MVARAFAAWRRASVSKMWRRGPVRLWGATVTSVPARVLATLAVSLLCVMLLAGALCEFDVGKGFTHPPRGDSRLDGPLSPPSPQWSPNGDQIVFSNVEDVPGIYHATWIHVASSDGSSLRTIAKDNAYHFTPDIAPDGSRIAYITASHDYTDEGAIDDFEIETSRLDGSDRRRLTDNAIYDISPVWSPDGRRIAFVSEGIYTIAADGSNVRLLLPLIRRDPWKLESASGEYVVDQYPSSGLAWSPDGHTLAFILWEVVREHDSVGNSLQRAALYTIGTDGTGLTQLYVTAAGDLSRRHWMYGHPAWSPDGEQLAFFVSTFNEKGEAYKQWTERLFVIGPDGSGLREVAEMVNYLTLNTVPTWSPDGTRLLFSLRPFNEEAYSQSIFTVGSDGSGLLRVGRGAYASWSPDGSRIAILNLYDKEDKAAFLFTVAPDGSDVRVVVRKDGGYGLRAANAKCILSFCW